MGKGMRLNSTADICGRAAALAMLIASASVPAAAQTQPFEAVQGKKTWRLEVGGGAVYGFAPFGDDPNRLNVAPWASFTYRDRIYANLLDGLGVNLVKRETLHAGLQLRPQYGQDTELEGLELPGLGADLTAYAFADAPLGFVVGGRLQQDISGVSDGLAWFASAARRDVTPIGLLQTSAYMRGSDAGRARTYFGVTEAEEAATGIDAYTPDGGPQAAGIALLMMTPLGERFGVGAFANYERVLGDAADSPLVARSDAKEDIVRFGLIFVRRWSSAD
jgi:outer membrane scaffolding protein for murein synthesis (MipA/OmpV family)